MKKLFTLALSLAMALTLVSCGNKETPPSLVGTNSTVPSGSGQSAEAPNNNQATPTAGAGGTETEVFENLITLSIDKTHYEQEERIEVTLDFDEADQDSAVILIINSEAEHGKATPVQDACEEMRWLADFSEIPFYLWAPIKDGLYDVRVYSSSEPGKELASVSFAVGDAQLAQVAAPPVDPPKGGDGDAVQQSGLAWPSISYLSAADAYTGDGRLTQVKEWDASGENEMWTIYYDGATFESVERYVADLVAAGWINHYADEDGNYMENETDEGIARSYYCTCDYAEVEIQVADFSISMNFTDEAEFSFNFSIEFLKAQ